MSHQGVPRSPRPVVVTVDAGPGADPSPGPDARRVARVRFHVLVVRAYREWESGARGPVWLRCSADRPGVVPPEE
jgi:hypothetical protein